MPKANTLGKILARVNKNGPHWNGSACWEWTGHVGRIGYGQVGYENQVHSVHQLLYRLLVGPTPEGMELDHLCRNRRCANPAHLEPVTHQENARRGTTGEHMREKSKAITHCPQGHRYTPENTKVKNGMRHCRECGRIFDRKRYAADPERYRQKTRDYLAAKRDKVGGQ